MRGRRGGGGEPARVTVALFKREAENTGVVVHDVHTQCEEAEAGRTDLLASSPAKGWSPGPRGRPCIANCLDSMDGTALECDP